MSSGDFTKKVIDNLAEEGIFDLHEGTPNKWINNHQTPDPRYYGAIAKALGVSESEIRAGKRLETESLKKEINKLEAQGEKISIAINFTPYVLRMLASVCYIAGIYLLNLSVWKNPWVLLSSMVLFAVLFKYDRKKNPPEKMNFKERVKRGIDDRFFFVKFIFQDNLVSNIWLHNFTIIVVLAFLPLVESQFYKGKYYLSSTLFILYGTLLLLKSLKK
jgi:hypothetical protein